MSERVKALLGLIARLRAPDGCAWDREQTFRTIAPYTIEEAYEVADAIERGDRAALKDELGDLLFQVVFHAQMASEEGAFGFDDIAEAIVTKMVRRHPHVFGAEAQRTADEQTVAWEALKAAERAAASTGPARTLDGIAAGLPALLRAQKLQKRVARVGFEWPDLSGVFAKLDEEIGELKEAIASGSRDDMEAELGDVLFVLTNVAMKLGTDPETALRRTNAKFVRRFEAVEARLAERGKTPESSTLEEMDALWTEVKRSGL
jgi:nucleoside triphosphate diphosphatase